MEKMIVGLELDVFEAYKIYANKKEKDPRDLDYNERARAILEEIDRLTEDKKNGS